MSTIPQSIGGEAVTTRLAMRMEDSLQAFAVRAACFIGELDVPYSEEFDGHDFGATHIIACVGDEPVGALRVRWFQSFAMPERLAVLQRFRGHNIGQLLLERCRTLAVSRGCNTLYAQALPADVKYWEKQGWRRLVAEGASSGPKHIVAMAIPIMAGMLLQTLYYVVDLYFVSRLGNAAIAGVSAAGNLMFVIFSLTQMLGVGVGRSGALGQQPLLLACAGDLLGHGAPNHFEVGQVVQWGQTLHPEPVLEGGPNGPNAIAMSGADGSISLEPAGQFELSGAPLENLHETCAETGRHLEQVKAIGDRFGIGFLGLGMWPEHAPHDRVPKLAAAH